MMNRLLFISLLGMSLVGNFVQIAASSRRFISGQGAAAAPQRPGRGGARTEDIGAGLPKDAAAEDIGERTLGRQTDGLGDRAGSGEAAAPADHLQPARLPDNAGEAAEPQRATKTAVDTTFSRFGTDKKDRDIVSDFATEVASAYRQREGEPTSKTVGEYAIQGSSRTATDIKNGLRSKLILVRKTLADHRVREQAKLISKTAPEVGKLYNERGESFWKKRGIKSAEDLLSRSNELIAEIANGREHMSISEKMGSWLKKQMSSLPVKSPLALAGMLALAIVTIKAIGILTGGVGAAIPCLAVGIWFGVRQFNRNRVKKALMEVINLQRDGLDIGTQEFQRLFQSVVDAKRQLKDAAELPTEKQLLNVVELFQQYSPAPKAVSAE